MDDGRYLHDQEPAQWMRLVQITNPTDKSGKVRLTQCNKPMLIDFLLETTALLAAERRLTRELEEHNKRLSKRMYELELALGQFSRVKNPHS